MTEEIWKPIKGYEGYYEISNQGRVKSIRNNLIMKQSKCKGYYIVNFSVKGTSKNFRVNRLVAEAFIPNPNNLPEVNHKDYNKENNEASNLEWCTHKYNVKDMRDHYGIKRNFNKCIVCGKMLKDYKAIRCVNCYSNFRYEKDYLDKPNREELKDLIKNNPMSVIGKMFGVSDNAVRKWCKRYNLPYKSTEIKKYTDEEWYLI